MQTVAELHDIPANPEPIDPAGAGVTWTRQLVPSHRSASGTLVPELSRLAPPAVHALAEVQDTAKNSATAGPAGGGGGRAGPLLPAPRPARAVGAGAGGLGPTPGAPVPRAPGSAPQPPTTPPLPPR